MSLAINPQSKEITTQNLLSHSRSVCNQMGKGDMNGFWDPENPSSTSFPLPLYLTHLITKCWLPFCLLVCGPMSVSEPLLSCNELLLQPGGPSASSSPRKQAQAKQVTSPKAQPRENCLPGWWHRGQLLMCGLQAGYPVKEVIASLWKEDTAYFSDVAWKCGTLVWQVMRYMFSLLTAG